MTNSTQNILKRIRVRKMFLPLSQIFDDFTNIFLSLTILQNEKIAFTTP